MTYINAEMNSETSKNLGPEKSDDISRVCIKDLKQVHILRLNTGAEYFEVHVGIVGLCDM